MLQGPLHLRGGVTVEQLGVKVLGYQSLRRRIRTGLVEDTIFLRSTAVLSTCGCGLEREFFIENLLVRIHFIIVMIWWTGLALPGGFGPSLSYTHSPTLSLTHTYTRALSLSVSSTQTHTHTDTHTDRAFVGVERAEDSLSHTLTHSLTHSLSHTYTHALSIRLYHTHTHRERETERSWASRAPRTLSLSYTHSLTHSLSLSHTHTHTLPLYLSLSHTHTNTDRALVGVKSAEDARVV